VAAGRGRPAELTQSSSRGRWGRRAVGVILFARWLGSKVRTWGGGQTIQLRRRPGYSIEAHPQSARRPSLADGAGGAPTSSGNRRRLGTGIFGAISRESDQICGSLHRGCHGGAGANRRGLSAMSREASIRLDFAGMAPRYRPCEKLRRCGIGPARSIRCGSLGVSALSRKDGDGGGEIVRRFPWW